MAGMGVTKEGAIRDGTSEEITRGTHLTAVYPALFFYNFLNDYFFEQF